MELVRYWPFYVMLWTVVAQGPLFPELQSWCLGSWPLVITRSCTFLWHFVTSRQISVRQHHRQVSFPQCSAILQVTLSLFQLCLPLREIDCFCSLGNESLCQSSNVFYASKTCFVLFEMNFCTFNASGCYFVILKFMQYHSVDDVTSNHHTCSTIL